MKDDSKVDQELVILTFDQYKNCREKFEKDAKTAYMQALRDQVISNTHFWTQQYMTLFFEKKGSCCNNCSCSRLGSFNDYYVGI